MGEEVLLHAVGTELTDEEDAEDDDKGYVEGEDVGAMADGAHSGTTEAATAEDAGTGVSSITGSTALSCASAYRVKHVMCT